MTALDNATGTEPAVLAQVLRGDPEPGSVTDHVALERVGSVAVVTLARPEQYNALSLASWRRLGVIFTDLGAEGDLRAVVVRGAGDRAFGAGADIKEFPQVRLSPEDALVYEQVDRGGPDGGHVPRGAGRGDGPGPGRRRRLRARGRLRRPAGLPAGAVRVCRSAALA